MRCCSDRPVTATAPEQDPIPLDISRLVAATFIGDVIPVPEMTPLLKAARENGCCVRTRVRSA